METFVKPNVGAGANTLAASWYVSPKSSRKNANAYLRREWLCVGREESDSRRPGDFFTVECAAKASSLRATPPDNVHAFFNVCRHRGTRICSDAVRPLRGFDPMPVPCLDLRARRQAEGRAQHDRSAGLRPRDYPLKEARVALWEGFIFVNLLATTPTAVRRSVRAADRPLCALAYRRPARRRAAITTIVACNWKLIFMNYSECYHCPLVHPQLDKLSPSDSGRNDLSRRPVSRRLFRAARSRHESDDDGRSPRPPIGNGRRRRPRSRILLHDLSVAAAQHAPRLRDGALRQAARPRAHRGRLRVALRSEDDRGSRASIRATSSIFGISRTARIGT